MAAGGAGNRLDLPVVDLASSDLRVAAESIRKACVESGFFYVVNHGVEEGSLKRLFAESRKFFELPMEEKMALLRNSNNRGYTRPTPRSSIPRPNSKETSRKVSILGLLEMKVCRMMLTSGLLKSAYQVGGRQLRSTVQVHCQVDDSDDGNYGASAHSDYGMITLLATDGTPGLQICREKDRHPQLWEDVHHIDGALIVNIGDLLERWTNCIYRSTVHRVVAVGKERYSVAFFLEPNPDLVVQCLESCCSKSCPPRFPPIKSGDYLKERLSVTYK